MRLVNVVLLSPDYPLVQVQPKACSVWQREYHGTLVEGRSW